MSTITITDIGNMTIDEKIGMKQVEINSLRMIISRREEIISKRNRESAQLSACTERLIASTNEIRRELIEAEADLRQLQVGIDNTLN